MFCDSLWSLVDGLRDIHRHTHIGMNVLGETVGEAREKIFCSIIMKEGEIARGVLVSRMHISEQTFAREYRSYLEVYPAIKYGVASRKFTYSP